MGFTASRQRAHDQTRKLRQPPSDPAEPDLDDLTDVNGGLAIGETLREPSPGGQRQPPPSPAGQQTPKSEILKVASKLSAGDPGPSKFRNLPCYCHNPLSHLQT